MMRWATTIAAPGILVAGLSVAAYQPSGSTVALENPLARALAVTLPPHQPSAPRDPAIDRVLVFRDAGQITLTTAGKSETVTVKPGDVRWMGRGAAPFVMENTTGRPIELVEIEPRNTPKDPPLVLPQRDPPVADAGHYTIAFENDRVRALGVLYEPHTKGAVHEHVRDRVVVNLSAAVRARFGDVRMAGAGTHSEENDTDVTEERIAVELK